MGILFIFLFFLPSQGVFREFFFFPGFLKLLRGGGLVKKLFPPFHFSLPKKRGGKTFLVTFEKKGWEGGKRVSGLPKKPIFFLFFAPMKTPRFSSSLKKLPIFLSSQTFLTKVFPFFLGQFSLKKFLVFLKKKPFFQGLGEKFFFIFSERGTRCLGIFQVFLGNPLVF